MIIVRLLSPEPFWLVRHHQSLLGSREPTLSWNQLHSSTSKKANKRRTLVKSPVSGEKLWVCSRPFALLPAWLLASLASLNRVHAVAGSGVGLARRNRTSRFRFCAVAAR